VEDTPQAPDPNPDAQRVNKRGKIFFRPVQIVEV
jgi:hypothetical protein